MLPPPGRRLTPSVCLSPLQTPVGFGWTNGALISFGQLYGKTLVTPTCPNIAIEEVSTGANATNLAFNLAVDGASARFKGSRIPRGA